MRGRILVAALLVSGCGGGGAVIDLTIVPDPSLPGGLADNIRFLDVSASGADSGSHSYPLAGPFREERIVIRTKVVSGMVRLRVVGRDASGVAQVSAVSAAIALSPDAPASVRLSLTVGSGGIDRFAGQLGGAGTADGKGPLGRFDQPQGVAIVGTTAYVADTFNQIIRAVDLTTGDVTTVAGFPLDGSELDGPKRDARFRDPQAIVSDGSNLFIGDFTGGTVRKMVIATGAVTTLAAPPTFSNVSGLALGTSDTLFVADAGRNRISVMTLVTNNPVTCLASCATADPGNVNGASAQAKFNAPRGLAFYQPMNQLFVADANNNSVRRIDLNTAMVATHVGGLNRPSGVAVSGPNLLIADTNNSVIEQATLAAGGALSVVAGGVLAAGSADGDGLTTARFNSPAGIALSNGMLYVTDTWNHDLRRVDLASAGHTVTRIAGSVPNMGWLPGSGANPRFSAPTAMVLVQGTIYLTDTWNHAIRTIDLATGTVDTLAPINLQYSVAGIQNGSYSQARFSSPRGIASDGNNLYISDNGSHTIRQIDLTARMVTTLAGAPAIPGTADGIGGEARFSYPEGLALDNGSLYVADADNDTVRKIDLATGRVTTIAGLPRQPVPRGVDGRGSDALFDFPTALAADGKGNLYVTDQASHAVRKIALATSDVTTVTGVLNLPGSSDGLKGDARLYLPDGIALDGLGNLFIADSGNDTLRTLALDSRVLSTVAGVPLVGRVQLGALPGLLNSPTGILALPGRLLVTSWNESAILQIPTP